MSGVSSLSDSSVGTRECLLRHSCFRAIQMLHESPVVTGV